MWPRIHLKKFGVLYERSIEFFVEKNKMIGNDKIISKYNLDH